VQTKNMPGGKGRIPYLLRCCFREAEEGDREAAMTFWNQAVSEGYVVKTKTKKHLIYTLGKASGIAE
jgi:hypothetical protein